MAHTKLAIFRRRLFTIFSVLSLLLCIATIALWVRSYWAQDSIEDFRIFPGNSWAQHFRRDARWLMQSAEGLISYTRAPQEEPFKHVSVPPSVGTLLGFGYLGNGDEVRVFWFPHWFLALLFAILPALYLRSLIRSRCRLRLGLCPVCGYDLRATPQRCPECGTAAGRMQ